MPRVGPPRARPLRTLYFILLGFFPAVLTDQSSSEHSLASLDEAELLRDAPLYPPLQSSDTYRFDFQPTLQDDKQNTESDQTNIETEYFYKTDDSVLNQPDVEIRNVKTFDVNDEPETNIEDSVVVAPERTEKLEFIQVVEPQNNVFEMYANERDFFTPDNVYNSENPFKTNIVASDLPIETREPSAGFIVAPGSNSDEVKRLLDDEAKVEDEDDNKEQKLENTDRENEDRIKRSSGQAWEKPAKSRRVKTGDTILNIRGAVRDAIGDAGAAPGPRASSRVDAFVIRPSPVMRDEPRDQAREAESRRERQPPQPQKLEKELLVEAHARARIACDLVNATNIRWYKDNEQVTLPVSAESAGGEAYRSGAGEAVEIPRASRHHAAKWRCGGRDRSGRPVAGLPTRLRIYEPVRSVYLAVDGRRLDAGNTWVPVRDKTVLEVRCVAEGGVPPPDLSWRLLALEPALDHRPYLRIHHTNYSVEGMSWSRVVVTAARELHNATLQCEGKQRKPAPGAHNSSNHYDVMTAKLEIHVTYPPSFVISRWPGFGVSLWAGRAAALRCDVDSNPPARPAWTRDADAPAPHTSPAPMESADGSATLRWAALRPAHAGWYQCRASWLDTEYSSIGYYLNVLSPDESATSATETNEEPVHQKVEVPLGGNVQLHCPKGSVGCWWRRVVGNASDNWAPAGSHHAHGVLGIAEAMWEEGGEYRCVGARAAERERLRELKRVTLSVTGGATAKTISTEPAQNGWRLTCGVCGRNLRVLWVTSGRSQPAILTPDLSQHCWRAILITPDSEEVWCVAVSSSGGAVAVFPKRSLAASLSPARHAVRALQSGTPRLDSTPFLLTPFVFLLAFVLV
ncbi:uncharacterized protein LOC123703647 [Colias croceus]|uniref:uncharacterized protein LOC123703647 n=1 Tax=Colias crocea TaxID=72248 RepID=UPI001E27C40B|nr:uncharacterized protein LOC123703647 [Colias croceus]